MKLQPFVFILLLSAIICPSSNLLAQHNDVEFGYDNLNNPSNFLLSPLSFNSTTSDGIIIVRSSMRELDPFNAGEFSADQPGFATDNAEGLAVNPGDCILISALNASEHSAFGVGYVNFYNPATNSLEAAGRIAFIDNRSGTPDLVLNGDTIESGVDPQFIERANNSGVVHDHITWDLLDDATAPVGAYGILVQLQSDYEFDGTVELSSDPFWLVFNYGMSEDDFEELALASFGVGEAAPVLLGDVNLDGVVSFLDISSFIGILSGGGFQAEADCDENGVVSFLDIAAFIGILSGS
jgi:hypothetical protein